MSTMDFTHLSARISLCDYLMHKNPLFGSRKPQHLLFLHFKFKHVIHVTSYLTLWVWPLWLYSFCYLLRNFSKSAMYLKAHFNSYLFKPSPVFLHGTVSSLMYLLHVSYTFQLNGPSGPHLFDSVCFFLSSTLFCSKLQLTMYVAYILHSFMPQCKYPFAGDLTWPKIVCSRVARLSPSSETGSSDCRL